MLQYTDRKRILVTSGTGFLGSHLVDKLLALGDDIICADKTIDYFELSLNGRNAGGQE